jgi:CheY-like chemotaxis protein
MTAHAMSSDREICLSSGMDDYFAKPITAAARSAMIEKFCYPAACLPIGLGDMLRSSDGEHTH